MTIDQIKQLIARAKSEANFWSSVLAGKSCQSCKHYQRYGCDLAEGEMPPQEVLHVGCGSYEYDEVPF